MVKPQNASTSVAMACAEEGLTEKGGLLVGCSRLSEADQRIALGHMMLQSLYDDRERSQRLGGMDPSPAATGPVHLALGGAQPTAADWAAHEQRLRPHDTAGGSGVHLPFHWDETPVPGQSVEAQSWQGLAPEGEALQEGSVGQRHASRSETHVRRQSSGGTSLPDETPPATEMAVFKSRGGDPPDSPVH